MRSRIIQAKTSPPSPGRIKMNIEPWPGEMLDAAVGIVVGDACEVSDGDMVTMLLRDTEVLIGCDTVAVLLQSPVLALQLLVIATEVDDRSAMDTKKIVQLRTL